MRRIFIGETVFVERLSKAIENSKKNGSGAAKGQQSSSEDIDRLRKKMLRANEIDQAAAREQQTQENLLVEKIRAEMLRNKNKR